MGITHYALLPNVTDLQEFKITNSYGIKVISYEPENSLHTEVSEFLSRLVGSETSEHSSMHYSSVQEMCIFLANKLVETTGYITSIFNILQAKGQLHIELFSRSRTGLELQKETLGIINCLAPSSYTVKQFSLKKLVINLRGETPATTEYTLFCRSRLLYYANFTDIRKFKDAEVDVRSFWKSIKFYQIREVGTLYSQTQRVDFPFIGF